MFLCILLFFLLGSSIIVVTSSSGDTEAKTSDRSRRSNILVLITDDQDVEIGGIDHCTP
jgi:hypothetical protein